MIVVLGAVLFGAMIIVVMFSAGMIVRKEERQSKRGVGWNKCLFALGLAGLVVLVVVVVVLLFERDFCFVEPKMVAVGGRGRRSGNLRLVDRYSKFIVPKDIKLGFFPPESTYMEIRVAMSSLRDWTLRYFLHSD